MASRLRILAGLVTVAAVVVTVAIVVSSGSARSTAGPVHGTRAVGLLDGIPQQGTTLGEPDAAVTLVEYADLRCPICREFTLATLPSLIEDYVRTGKVRVEMRLQTFVGEQFAPGDSERAARFALAAAQQGRFWQVAELFYRNQGDETRSYVTDRFLRRLGAEIPGLDVAKALAGRGAVSDALKASEHAFTAAGFNGTPSFEVGRTGGPLKVLPTRSLATSEFTGPIDALLVR
jgi:protein-disulfide isomerase